MLWASAVAYTALVVAPLRPGLPLARSPQPALALSPRNAVAGAVAGGALAVWQRARTEALLQRCKDAVVGCKDALIAGEPEMDYAAVAADATAKSKAAYEAQSISNAKAAQERAARKQAARSAADTKAASTALASAKADSASAVGKKVRGAAARLKSAEAKWSSARAAAAKSSAKVSSAQEAARAAKGKAASATRASDRAQKKKATSEAKEAAVTPAGATDAAAAPQSSVDFDETVSETVDEAAKYASGVFDLLGGIANVLLEDEEKEKAEAK